MRKATTKASKRVNEKKENKKIIKNENK